MKMRELMVRSKNAEICGGCQCYHGDGIENLTGACWRTGNRVSVFEEACDEIVPVMEMEP